MTRHLTLLALLLVSACKSKEAEAPAPPPLTGEAPGVDLTVAMASRTTDVYDVSLTTPETVAPGQPAELTISLQAKGGMHVNAEYPLNFRPIRVVNSAKFGKDKFDLLGSATRTPCEGKNAKDACTLTAPIPFTVDTAGPRRIEGVLAFSVCDKNRCLIEKATLGMDVVAK